MPTQSKTIAMLEYTFLFDPKELWRTRSDFEYDFAKFLKEYGIVAEFVPNEGGDFKRVFHLYKPQTSLPTPIKNVEQNKKLALMKKSLRK